MQKHQFNMNILRLKAKAQRAKDAKGFWNSLTKNQRRELIKGVDVHWNDLNPIFKPRIKHEIYPFYLNFSMKSYEENNL
jgi:hypothetical protein